MTPAWTITKTFTFAAAHHLTAVPEGHKCARPHGHNYAVTVELAAPMLDAQGFVTDYGDLDDLKEFIAIALDHRDLNDAMANPTAELLAAQLYQEFRPMHPQLQAVTVAETPGTTATYRP